VVYTSENQVFLIELPIYHDDDDDTPEIGSLAHNL